ncbi:MAG: hypothetical protein L0G70_11980 [Rubrobacter sp.]|nr:hypothetical protein [Rubrobacter sp.]
MDDYRNERGPQGAGEPYGGGAPDGGSGFYLGLEDLPDHVVYWDPTLPLREHPESGRKGSVRVEAGLAIARSAQLEAFADFTPDAAANALHGDCPTADGGGEQSYTARTVPPDSVVPWDPTLPLRQNPSCYGAVGRGKDDSVRTSRQSTGSELSFPGTEWAFIEKPVDLVLDFDVDPPQQDEDELEADEGGADV